MKLPILLCLFLSATSLAADELQLMLSFPSDKMTNQQGLRANAKIENRGKETVTLVLPGDGSSAGLRTPIVGFSVIPISSNEKHPKTIPLQTGGRCGNINPLHENEVFSLKKNEVKDLGTWVGSLRIKESGRYRVVYYYQNVPEKDVSGLALGKHAPGVEEKLKRSAAVSLISNEVIIEVKAEDGREISDASLDAVTVRIDLLTQDDSLVKIEFDLDKLDEDGLRGPPTGKVAVSYEFAIPNTEHCKAQVRAIDSTVQFMAGSKGRIQADEGQCLCIGSTHQENYIKVLHSLSELPYIERIIECFFE